MIDLDQIEFDAFGREDTTTLDPKEVSIVAEDMRALLAELRALREYRERVGLVAVEVQFVRDGIDAAPCSNSQVLWNEIAAKWGVSE